MDFVKSHKDCREGFAAQHRFAKSHYQGRKTDIGAFGKR